MPTAQIQPPRAAADIIAQLQASLGDGYEVERELTAPGTSRVFIARERIMNRASLIKVIGADLTSDLDFDQFVADVERVAAINSPNIVPPLMLGVVDGLPYIITPYVPGVALRDRLREQPPLMLDEIVAALRNVAEALQVAHGANVLHLDLNPDTILLSQRAALLTDVGVVRALRSARPAGSSHIGDPSYLAPEQLSPAGKPDHHADLYAWGCVAYEMLTGMTPYPRVVRDGKVVDTSSEEPAPISLVRRDVPSTLVRLIMRTLSRDITSRPASAENLVQVLQTVDVSERAMAERNQTPAFVPAVAGEMGSTTLRTTRVVAVVEPPKKRNTRRIAALAVASLAALTGGIAFARRTPPLPEEPPLPPPSAGVVAKSATVLPLVMAGGTSADSQFAAGISQEIARALARAGVLVSGTGSAHALSRQGLDPRTIARRLGVASVLTGSVQRTAVGIRLSLSLRSAADGSNKWSAEYDRPLAELFAAEDEIARAVTARVQGTREADAGATIGSETSVPEAHEFVLRGSALAAIGTALTLSDAIRLFQSAIARDSAYAQAFGALALACTRLSELQSDASDATIARCSGAANRAVALDSSRAADAYAALGYIRAIQHANRDAERMFKRAVSLDSMTATTWGWYGVLAAHIGDYATGHARILRARALEPMSLLARAWDAQVFFGEGKLDRAEQVTRPAVALDSTASPTIATHAEALMALLRDSAALALLQTRVPSDGANVSIEAQASLAYASAKAGHDQQARDIMLAMRDAGGGVLPARATIAATLAALGDVDSAIGVLTKASARHDPVLFTLNHARRFDLLRKDPRGAAIFARIERW